MAKKATTGNNTPRTGRQVPAKGNQRGKRPAGMGDTATATPYTGVTTKKVLKPYVGAPATAATPPGKTRNSPTVKNPVKRTGGGGGGLPGY